MRYTTSRLIIEMDGVGHFLSLCSLRSKREDTSNIGTIGHFLSELSCSCIVIVHDARLGHACNMRLFLRRRHLLTLCGVWCGIGFLVFLFEVSYNRSKIKTESENSFLEFETSFDTTGYDQSKGCWAKQ